MEVKKSPAQSRSIAALLLAMTWASAAVGADAPGSCRTGSGLAVLVGQDTVFLNRPARAATVGQSLWQSLLASAATGGPYLMTVIAGADRGALVLAPATTAADLQPPEVAHSLGQALSETSAASSFDLLIATTQGGEVDDAIRHTSCGRVVVLNAVYSLEQVKQGLQLSFVTQVLDVSTSTYQRSVITVLEYRSAMLPFGASTGAGTLAGAFESWLVEQHSMVLQNLRDATTDSARMASHQLEPANNGSTPMQLGKDVAHVICDGCRKSDRVISRTATRIWLQPADDQKVLRSLALGR